MDVSIVHCSTGQLIFRCCIDTPSTLGFVAIFECSILTICTTVALVGVGTQETIKKKKK